MTLPPLKNPDKRLPYQFSGMVVAASNTPNNSLRKSIYQFAQGLEEKRR